ncbi:MAG: hypothetical protein GX262_06775 [Clostridia bacterium]|jgi:hypothetical protein|nr:hypothetical protein [Clostridia bacterium]
MADKEVERFEDFLEDSFKKNVSRELRLSGKEVEYILSKYPKAIITGLSNGESSDGKHWYIVKF